MTGVGEEDDAALVDGGELGAGAIVGRIVCGQSAPVGASGNGPPEMTTSMMNDSMIDGGVLQMSWPVRFHDMLDAAARRPMMMRRPTIVAYR